MLIRQIPVIFRYVLVVMLLQQSCYAQQESPKQSINPHQLLFLGGQFYLSFLVAEELRTILTRLTIGRDINQEAINTIITRLVGQEPTQLTPLSGYKGFLVNKVYPHIPLVTWAAVAYLNYRYATLSKPNPAASVNEPGEATNKAHPRLVMPETIKETFASIAGCKEAKQELQDVVNFLKNPKKFSRLGAHVSKGILLTGLPGNGKTMLARAIAREANCTYLHVNASEFIQMYVGVGAARVRELFEFARANGPCIIFIDEIDAIGLNRNFHKGGSTEHEQTLNQLLAEMDGFDVQINPVIVIGATNRHTMLDPALVRSGRFDQIVTVPLPDYETRLEILQLHARNRNVDPKLDLMKIAEATGGFSGADMASIMNQAALMAVKNNRQVITQQDLDAAQNKVMQTVYRRMKAETSSLDAATRNPAEVIPPSSLTIGFNDVAGCQDAKEALQDVTRYLKNPQEFKKLGADISRGILLSGKPGDGKTMLAKAVAKEAGCMFLYVTGAAFSEQLMGIGAARVRALFEQARQYAPCIVFIDEFDAIGAKDPVGDRANTVNQFLAELDGFASNNHAPVIVLAAANNPHELDKSLTRSGRFDQKISIPSLTATTRLEVLNKVTKGITLSPHVNLELVARATPGFTGADLANLVNQATVLATRRNAQAVEIDDFEEARDIMWMGAKITDMTQSLEEQRVTAIHEAGHTLVSVLLPDLLSPFHKVTILPRGKALGITFSLPDENKHSYTKEMLVAIIMRALGGRIAEEIIVGPLSTGASNDFEHAYAMAREMVCSYGMSEQAGTIVYSQRYLSFNHSQKTLEMIDSESKKLVDEAYGKTKELLTERRSMLEKLSGALLEHKTMSAKEVYELLGLSPREIASLKD